MRQIKRTRSAVVGVLAVTLVVAQMAQTSTSAQVGSTSASPAGAALDCVNWRYGAADEPAPGVIPSEFNRADYKRTSYRDPNPALINSPQNHCGQMGMAVDLAWGINKGSAQVTIAVLDSGIRWRDANAMRDLATKAYINTREATTPCQSTIVNGDCNNDGMVNISDYGAIADRNGNGLADPEDLILDPLYNDGVDADRNGHIDDIAGWDFLYGDNNPLDTVDYGHGTGEAIDSSAAENGTGEVGSCPDCQFIPVRVGDSFIADGQRFAAGVLFALDSNATVIQEALGAINNPTAAQQAIDLAYARDVVVVASMADEASKHPNLPAALRHTMAVNSVTKLQSLLGGNVDGYLALNGCTNYGGRTFVSVESGSCSSEATGIAAGIVGVIESEARRQGIRLSANEVMQVVRAMADDVDFATPNAVDPANNFGSSTGGLLDTVRYPTTAGWDATFGYGRLNAYEAIKAVRDQRIPPSVDILTPNWFDLAPTSGQIKVEGVVSASRATSYDYRVEWAVGMQGPAYPATDTWHVGGSATGLTTAKRGVLATLDLAQIAQALPNGGVGTPTTTNNRPDEERFSVRVRVVVTAHGGTGDGLVGIDQRQVFVHHDADLVRGMPKRIAGVGTASPVFAQLDGRPGKELVIGTDDGTIHALRSDGSELPGFPVRTEPGSFWPRNSAAARAAGIRSPGAGIPVGGPAIADIDRNGTLEIVANAFDGRVYVWDTNGKRRSGFPQQVNANYSLDTPGVHNNVNRTKPAFYGSPSLGDLDGNGTLEIVAASADRHVYAWHHNGSSVAGFPVLVVDPAKVAAVDPVTHSVTFVAGSGAADGGELIATPALADLDGDRRPEIVVGAQEEYAEAQNIGDGQDVLALLSAVGTGGNSRLYAISAQGTHANFADTNSAHPHEHAYLPGWPAKLAMLALESLPTIGNGVSAQAAIGDVTAAHPGVEIVAAAAAGPMYVLNAQGQSVYGQVNGRDIPLAWAAGLDGSGRTRFGVNANTTDLIASVALFSGASVGWMNRDTRLDISAPVAGLSRLIDIQGSDFQGPADDQLTVWDGASGNAFSGVPHTTSDMAFFVTPAIADIDGDGRGESIAGNGLYTLTAVNADGRAPAGWPKLTGGWEVGTPGVGDWDGNGTNELAVVRRDGVLLVWHTRSMAGATRGWPRYGGNGRNTGAR